MKKALQVSITLTLLLLVMISVVQAQQETPYTTIRGSVYEDVDGDGKCVDTEVEGENPVPGIDIEFYNNVDDLPVVTLYTGSDGTYGLVGADYGNWPVKVAPGPEWVVTSEETRYAPVAYDNLVVLGIDFCIQKVSTVTVLLPVSGAASGSGWTLLAAFIGVGFVALGLGLEVRPKTTSLFRSE